MNVRAQESGRTIERESIDAMTSRGVRGEGRNVFVCVLPGKL